MHVTTTLSLWPEQALVLAVRLGASHLMWPPSHDRATFASESGDQYWAFSDAGETYDMPAIQQHFLGAIVPRLSPT
jgi:hypothetical protein